MAQRSITALTSVSIHAPGRGATTRYALYRCPRTSFNSRTREGCDVIVVSSHGRSSGFQFTHPGGVRLAPFSLRSF